MIFSILSPGHWWHVVVSVSVIENYWTIIILFPEFVRNLSELTDFDPTVGDFPGFCFMTRSSFRRSTTFFPIQIVGL